MKQRSEQLTDEQMVGVCQSIGRMNIKSKSIGKKIEAIGGSPAQIESIVKAGMLERIERGWFRVADSFWEQYPSTKQPVLIPTSTAIAAGSNIPPKRSDDPDDEYIFITVLKNELDDFELDGSHQATPTFDHLMDVLADYNFVVSYVKRELIPMKRLR